MYVFLSFAQSLGLTIKRVKILRCDDQAGDTRLNTMLFNTTEIVQKYYASKRCLNFFQCQRMFKRAFQQGRSE
jgi:hypothetical protein